MPGRGFAEKFAMLIATGFGVSLVSPFAPGTFGSVAGVLLSMWTVTLPVPLQALFALGLTFLAIPFCAVGERVFAKKDDGRIVADEWMLYPLGVLGLPLWDRLWLVPVSFVVIRLVDIVKPWPARGLQRIEGGLGVVIDDFFANLWSLGINWGIWLAYCRYFAG